MCRDDAAHDARRRTRHAHTPLPWRDIATIARFIYSLSLSLFEFDTIFFADFSSPSRFCLIVCSCRHFHAAIRLHCRFRRIIFHRFEFSAIIFFDAAFLRHYFIFSLLFTSPPRRRLIIFGCHDFFADADDIIRLIFADFARAKLSQRSR